MYALYKALKGNSFIDDINMEFSKKIFIVVSSINIFVIAFSCYMVWKTMDLTPLAYLIPAVAAETATGTDFYYNKAKAENKIKLKKSLSLELTGGDIGGNEE